MARTLRFLQDDPVLQCPKGSVASVGDPLAGQLIQQGIAEEVVETVAVPVPSEAVATDTGHGWKGKV
jgi:hypothetical protein